MSKETSRSFSDAREAIDVSVLEAEFRKNTYALRAFQSKADALLTASVEYGIGDATLEKCQPVFEVELKGSPKFTCKANFPRAEIQFGVSKTPGPMVFAQVAAITTPTDIKRVLCIHFANGRSERASGYQPADSCVVM